MSENLRDSVVLITSSDPAIHDFGTGFAIYSERQTTYILTCAHVVERVGGSEAVKVDNIQATVVASGSESGIDLVVLLVIGFKKTPLPLGIIGEKGKPFTATGFQRSNKEYSLRRLNGILGEPVPVGKSLDKLVETWDLKITDDYWLQPGYSGSPVVDAANNIVVGVVRTRQGDGQKGSAISIEAVERIWGGIPAAISLRKIEREAHQETGGIGLISSQQSDYLKVRIFVSALNDLSNEQRRIKDVVHKLNQDVGTKLRLALEVVDWRTHVAALVGFPWPVISNYFQIERCDIFVGVLWHRYSHPSLISDLETERVFKGGIEEEFELAYQLWKRKELPQIFIYFCERTPRILFDQDQYNRAQIFCGELSRRMPGLLRPYSTPAVFEKRVHSDLSQLLEGNSQSATSLIRGQAAISDLGSGLGYRPEPSERLSTWKQQDLNPLSRPKQPELRSDSFGEPTEDPQAPPPLSPEISDTVKNRLRPERFPGKLFGRQELLEVARWYVLHDKLPLLVYGIPGIGKTAFLATLFNDPEVKKIYSGEKILWINLRESGVSSLPEIVDEIAKALSYDEVLYEKSEAVKRRRLKVALSRDLHLPGIVFDNVDLEAYQEALLDFQKEITPHVVVGSRTRFALPDTREIHLGELAPNYAMDAFKSYASSTSDDDERIEVICELLGYHPQAIKIAASAIPADRLSLEELAHQLKHKRRELMSIESGDDFKLNMRISFEVSYDMSPPSEKRVFKVLGALAPSGASLAAIAAGSELPEFECETLLGQLQKRSLVERDERDPNHYRMHQLLHDFTQEMTKDMRS